MLAMDERSACAALKRRFEAEGLQIAENVPFDERGVRFEIDGFDATRRVGYEFISEEAGDSWDVGDDVIAELAKRREAGELFIFLIAESDAPDEATLLAKADAFLSTLPDTRPLITKPPATRPAARVKLAVNGTETTSRPTSKPAMKTAAKPTTATKTATVKTAAKPAAKAKPAANAAAKRAPAKKPAAKPKK
jgi:hypothetical protein